MNTVAGVLVTIFLVILLGKVFLVSGAGLLRSAFAGRARFNAFLEAGFGYFLGMAAFLALWRVLAAVIVSASAAFWVALGACLAYILFRLIKYRQDSLPTIKDVSGKIFAALAGLFIAVALLQIGLWLKAAPIPTDPFENFGSAHSARYTNIAETIYRSNRIPVLNQNFGQSMLATAPMYFGFNMPFLALNLWLSLSIFFLVITAYGIFRQFELKPGFAAFAAFLFMLGNTALSLTHVLSLDSNSPFLMSSYTDATANVATFFLFLFFLTSEGSQTGPLAPWIFMPAILGVYWNFSAPQNIVVGLGLLGLWCVFKLYKSCSLKNRLALFILCFALCAGLGATLGGMLTPAVFRDKDTIPGATDVSQPGQYTGIKPELPYALVWAGGGVYGTPYDPSDKALYVDLAHGRTKLTGAIIHKILWQLETNLWAALRVMFFPLLGLAGFYFLRQKFFNDAQKNSATADLWAASTVVFAIGFSIAFLIIVSGRKWEMSRFMIAPYALGMMFFCLCLYSWQSNFTSRFKRNLTLVLIAIVMTFGPITDALALIHVNFSTNQATWQKLKLFVRDPGIVGQQYWQGTLNQNPSDTQTVLP